MHLSSDVRNSETLKPLDPYEFIDRRKYWFKECTVRKKKEFAILKSDKELDKTIENLQRISG